MDSTPSAFSYQVRDLLPNVRQTLVEANEPFYSHLRSPGYPV